MEIEQFPVIDRFVEFNQRSYQVQSEFSSNQEKPVKAFLFIFALRTMFLNEHVPGICELLNGL